ncbi:MAG: 50S ribosomal protein L21 [Chloroflexia bacterium]|nr:50S ribosomal protein L21 [Chloroflexia bacterium]
MFAIIKTGGKQYKVGPGQTIEVERLPYDVGAEIDLEDVLLVSQEEDIQIGEPHVEGARVRVTVMAHVRGPKILAFRYKSKKRVRRRRGHRQELTRLRIDSIEA